ncbi:hypothetical protein ACJX0J_030352 [Zea mays]
MTRGKVQVEINYRMILMFNGLQLCLHIILLYPRSIFITEAIFDRVKPVVISFFLMHLGFLFFPNFFNTLNYGLNIADEIELEREKTDTKQKERRALWIFQYQIGRYYDDYKA